MVINSVINTTINYVLLQNENQKLFQSLNSTGKSWGFFYNSKQVLLI